MTQEAETMLRKALDRVDRDRKLIFATVLVVAVPMTWLFFRIIEAGRTGDVRAIVPAAMAFLVFWGSTLAFVVVLQVMVATKRILRAIELAAKPQA